LQNPYDLRGPEPNSRLCPAIFISISSSESNSNSRKPVLKCILRQENRTFIGSRLHSSQITTCRVS
ncbi:hypothetical protein M9458_035500, partial [Cirrhinus mrigala]